jgi:thymidylate synthase (FAD)
VDCRIVCKTEGYKGTEYEGQSLDNIISGIARISSSREVNELFSESDKLLNYCIKNAHWSIFDQADLTFQITTSMPIGEQCIRHQSFDFQKFSGRYAKFNNSLEPLEFRLQGKTNRQVGEEAIIPTINGNNAFIELDKVFAQIHDCYNQLTEQQVALETARFILPLLTSTTFYMKGSIRSWITFLNVRLHSHAQKEIIQLATKIKELFIEECPIISKALYNFEDADKMYILDRIVLEKYGVFQMIKDNEYKKIK